MTNHVIANKENITDVRREKSGRLAAINKNTSKFGNVSSC